MMSITVEHSIIPVIKFSHFFDVTETHKTNVTTETLVSSFCNCVSISILN